VICTDDGAHKSNTLAGFDPQKLDSVAFARKSDCWRLDGKDGFFFAKWATPLAFVVSPLAPVSARC
jgi:hypothetical protein